MLKYIAGLPPSIKFAANHIYTPGGGRGEGGGGRGKGEGGRGKGEGGRGKGEGGRGRGTVAL